MKKETEIARIIMLGNLCDSTPNEISRQIMSDLGIKEEQCSGCGGKGKIPTTGSAIVFPDRFPNEFMQCPVCKGLPLRNAIKATELPSVAEAEEGN